MDLIEVDGRNLEASQAVFELSPNRVRFEAMANLPTRRPNPAALREHERALGTAQIAQRPRNDDFGVAEPIDSGRVDPVDPELDRAMDRCDRVGIVLLPPPKHPVAAPHGPGTEPNP